MQGMGLVGEQQTVDHRKALAGHQSSNEVAAVVGFRRACVAECDHRHTRRLAGRGLLVAGVAHWRTAFPSGLIRMWFTPGARRRSCRFGAPRLMPTIVSGVWVPS